MRTMIATMGLALLAVACGAAEDKETTKNASAGSFAETCWSIGLDQGCGVVAAGVLNEAPGDKRLHWQIQDGASSEAGVGGGLAMFTETDEGELALVLSDVKAWRYEAPFLVRDGDAPALLVAHGTSRGTSASPINLAWQWRDDSWQPINLDAWHAEAEAMLGESAIQNGFRIDFENMLGVTPLWTANDGHCCPSGGWARVDFELRDGVLHVSDVSVAGNDPT